MRAIFTSVAIALLVSGPAVPAAAVVASAPQDPAAASQLVDSYLAWRGGAAYRQMQAFHVLAEVEAEGLKGSTEEWRTRSGFTRDDYDLGAAKGLSVRTPTAGWNKDAALVTPAEASSVRDALRVLAMEFGDALSGKPGATVERVPDEVIDGHSRSILRIKFGDSDTYDLILDSATGALHGRRYTIDGRSHFTRLSDWRVVEGVRFPFLLEGFRPDGKPDYVERVHSIDVDPALDAGVFAQPKTDRTLSFAAGKHSTGPIKYDPYTGTRIYIPARVNGHPVDVLLDSGADSSVLDEAFARTVGREKLGTSTATGTGGEQESGYAKDVKIEIGAMSLDLPTVSVVDLASVGKRIGIPLPVILGRDVFLQSIVEIDPSATTIDFHDPASFTPPPGATLVPLQPLGSLRSVPVSVEGLPDAPMIFDLGNGGYMTVSPEYWQKHDLLHGRKHSTRSSGAVGGEKINQVATLDTVRFAGVTFHDVPAEFTAPNPERNTASRAGNVGMPILGRFRMMIDFQNSRMWLVPIADRIDQPFERDRAGLRLVQDGSRLVVRHVSAGSPAAAARWKEGDEVVAIDGQPIDSGFARSALSKWMMRPVGTVVTLTMANGQKRRLKLADYF